MPYSFRHLAIQLVAALFVGFVAWPFYAVQGSLPAWAVLSLAAGACAGILAWATHQPLWWRIIHPLFLPLAWATSTLQIPPGWFLFALITLLLIYRGALNGRVPLYLSNRQTTAALLELADERHIDNMIDLGAGFGGVVRTFAQQRPQVQAHGAENAPLTWLIGFFLNRLTARRSTHAIGWHYGSLWHIDLGKFDLVYIFLSPEPMPALWEKAKAEMRPGSLLVSNSFAIPDVLPTSVLKLSDQRTTMLYCYQI